MEGYKLCSLSVILILDFIKLCTGVTYTVKEGGNPNTFIGNLGQDFNLSSLMNDGNLRFNFFDQNKPYVLYFNISENSGDLYTVGTLDRERICQFTSDCDVQMEVVVTSSKDSFYRKLAMTVIVEDINDHSPVFPVSSVNLSISESVSGTAITIDGASDPDSAKFSVKSYNITTPGSPFSTMFSTNLDGSSSVQLICDQELDRELIDFYQIRLVAIDGGIPPKTGSVLLNITVTDTNDNSPEFSNTEYNITVKEDIPINSTILFVTATDKDINENGRITYGLATRQSEEIKEIFTIEPITGEIKTIGRLVYKPGHKYKIIVEASDAGAQPRTTQSFVYVQVQDVENNPPEINLNLLSKDDYARVSELANIGAIVALFSVSDADIGWNGFTNCTLINDQPTNNVFSLQKSDPNDYQVIVAKDLDREKISLYNVTVYCYDAGTPPLSSSRSFNVSVLDENDNQPIFTQSTYRAQLMENNGEDDIILAVSASDLDYDINGDITYELQGDAWSDFWIDQKTGMIHAAKTFDRETKGSYEFHVLAKDGGKEPFTSTATVLLEIQDINDNPPEFTRPFYEFTFPENQPSGEVVERVIAEDDDLENNGIVTYTISENYEITVPFKLDPNGVLRTKKGLDRELQSRYDFTITATDQGFPQRRSSTVNVTVFVTDVNDNSPVIRIPEKSGHIVPLTLATPVNTPLYQIRAHDLDAGRNAELIFRIEDRNDTKIFDINDSGQVLVARPIESWETDMYMLHIAVYDNGSPQNFAKTVLMMSVTVSNMTGASQSDDGLTNQNLLIALTVVIVTAVLAATIVITIFVIRRMDKRKQDFFGGDVNSDRSSEAEVVPGLMVDGSKDFYSRPNNSVQLAPVVSHMSLEKSSSNNDFVYKPRIHTPSPINHPGGDNSDGDLQIHETHDQHGRTTPSLNRLTSLRLHQALLQSHDKQWTNHSEPQQQGEMYQQRSHGGEDSHSQLSGDGDSGRGGSVSDGHSNMGNSHDADDPRIIQLQNLVKQSGRRGTPPHLQKDIHINDDNYSQQLVQQSQKPNITPRDMERNKPSVHIDQSKLRNTNLEKSKYSNSNSNIFQTEDREIPEIQRYHSYRGDRHQHKNNNYYPNSNSSYSRGKSSPGIQMGLSSIHLSPSHHREDRHPSFRSHQHKFGRQSSSNSDNYPPLPNYPMDDKYAGYRDRFLDETFDSITTTACDDDDNTTTSGSYTIDNNAAEDFVELNPAQLKDIFV